VPDDHGLPLAQRLDQPDGVADQVQDRVGLDRLRPARAAIAALVRSDRVEARLGKRGQLVAPGVPALGEAVQQQHRRARARLGDVHAQPAAGVDQTVVDLGHRHSCALTACDAILARRTWPFHVGGGS